MHTSTSLLPWIPNNPKDFIKSIKQGSIMLRIFTVVDIDDPNIGKIHAINTHLDYNTESVQKRQLNSLYKVIKTLKNESIVLTGDFNMEVTDNNFREFINALSELGLKRVEVNDKTNADKFLNKTTIDHIFIPEVWTVVNAGLITGWENITDHNGVYADVKVR